MKSAWFRTNLTSVMGEAHHMFLSNVDEKFSLITPVGSGSSTYPLERLYYVV